jgi:hypothetical protein
MMVTPKVEIYDTTLRDGSQQVGLDLTVADKLRVAVALDGLGVDVIEGGWPGSNPKDAEFFERAKELDLRHATMAAFGATRLPGRDVEDDASLAALLAAETPIVTLVGKSWTLHVDEALRTTRRRTSRWWGTRSPTWRPQDAVSCSTPSTSSTATRPTAVTHSRYWPRRRRPARTHCACATPTAACCRTTSPGS